MEKQKNLVKFSVWITAAQKRFLKKGKPTGSAKVREALKERFKV